MNFAPSWIRITVVCALCLTAAGARRAFAADGERSPVPGNCVKVSTEARYAAYAYDHVVTLESGCDQAMRCEVSTDVNPTPSTVELARGETKSVLTYRGSPAREFKANVECKAQ
jgi:hypothetical protein